MIEDILGERNTKKKFRKSADDIIKKMTEQSDLNNDGKISKQ